MPYGLTDKEMELLTKVFERSPEVDEVYLYGSRARGDWKETSDIDLAVKFSDGHGGSKGIGKLRLALEGLPFLYEVDLVDIAEIAKGDFLREFEKDRELIYSKQGEIRGFFGGVWETILDALVSWW